ncbi:S8 family serine peptidase [Paucibacter sp. PLA-PC-4]|uniref:S8 family peptidase n=1 Tax=Paucibacter sp. PLA-PC-4 TaxID=2993655 RepID=UPI0022490008|nr:S8 family serine peptidase [Paucibacter sp. PLA-PC-4]MCX2862248.1 S8 family serine peptidase [Paucibacter sp. PLA-PC-4]
MRISTEAQPPSEDWKYEVVALAKPKHGGRLPHASPSPGAELRDLIATGRAERVFAPMRASSSADGFRFPLIYTLKVQSRRHGEDLVERLRHDSEGFTVYIAPTRYLAPARRAQQRSAGAAAGTSASFNDWGMQYVNAHASGAINASAIKVAVVDTGVDASHPDLVGAIDTYINCTSEPDEDLVGHGTHVCGILAGTGTPPSGMRGASNARLVVIKGLGLHYRATDYYRALGEAMQRAFIINLSLGGPDHDPTEELLIAQALQAGAVVIAAAGNDSDNGAAPNFPAKLQDVIAVGAIDDQGQRADFSNAGPHVALVAPGVDIWSTVPTSSTASLFKGQSGYGSCSGTSMSAPFVTALAARVAAAQSQPGMALAPTIRANLPIERCPNQTKKTHDLGVGYLRWGGTIRLNSP